MTVSLHSIKMCNIHVVGSIIKRLSLVPHNKSYPFGSSDTVSRATYSF